MWHPAIGAPRPTIAAAAKISCSKKRCPSRRRCVSPLARMSSSKSSVLAALSTYLHCRMTARPHTAPLATPWDEDRTRELTKLASVLQAPPLTADLGAPSAIVPTDQDCQHQGPIPDLIRPTGAPTARSSRHSRSGLANMRRPRSKRIRDSNEAIEGHAC